MSSPPRQCTDKHTVHCQLNLPSDSSPIPRGAGPVLRESLVTSFWRGIQDPLNMSEIGGCQYTTVMLTEAQQSR